MPESTHATSDEPLVMAVHGLEPPNLRDARQQEVQRTRSGRVHMLLVLAACAAPVVLSYLSYYVLRPQTSSAYSSLIQPSRSLPAVNWTSLSGGVVPAPSLRGQWLLVAVVGDQCSAGCERLLLVQRQLREMLGRERDRLDKVVLHVGAAPLPDPLRAALLAAPQATVLKADRAELARWLQPAAGQALEDHLYLVDPMGEWMMRVPPQPDPAKLKRDLERLLRASAGWDQAGR